MRLTVIPIVIGALGTNSKGLLIGVEELEIIKLNIKIIKIGKNTEKIPGDLRWLAVTQTPVEDH